MKKITMLGLLCIVVSQVSFALDPEVAERAHQYVRTQRKFEIPESEIHDSLVQNYNVNHQEANQLMDGSHPLLQDQPYAAQSAQPTVEIARLSDDEEGFNPGLAPHPADLHHQGHRDSYQERLASETAVLPVAVEAPASKDFNPGLAYHPMDDAGLREVEALKKSNMPEGIIRQQLEEDGFTDQQIDEALAKYNEQVSRAQRVQAQRATSSLVEEVNERPVTAAADLDSQSGHQEASDLQEARLPGHLSGKLAIARKLQSEIFEGRPVMLTDAEKTALMKYFIKYDFEVSGVKSAGQLSQQERDGLVKATRRFAQELLEEMKRDRSLKDAFNNHGIQGILGDAFKHLDAERRQVVEDTVQNVMHSDLIEKVSMIGIPASVIALIIGGIIATVVSQ